jgi:single-stranded-DNA-specific exonuclease
MGEDAGAGYLGVARSLGNRRWRLRVADERGGLAIAQRFGVPEIVGRIMAARGVSLDSAESFLNPRLRDSLPDPSRFLDMERAVERLMAALREGEKIALFGDYDVDGATSLALLRRYLAAVGADPLVYVPDRLREGYGPNEKALLALREKGAKLILTLDCGTGAHEPLAAAASAGLDIIVVDHHVSEPRLPAAVAFINPNRFDEKTPHRELAAVGVAFLLVVALNRRLRMEGWFERRDEPDLLGFLDLVALGTVCDVVPLIGINRALVRQGLKVMARRANIGLTALADVAGVDERPSAYHLGFVLGPRANAGGRVGEAGLGARLLATDDREEARAIAKRLDAYNRERRAIEEQVREEAFSQVEGMEEAAGPLIVAGEGWHPGVIGIVASRLVERYHRPALVIAFDGDAGKGSGRSISGVALGPEIIAARQAGLLLAGGGHAMAAGFTVHRQRLDAFRAFLDERMAPQLAAVDPVPSLGIDGALTLGGATRELLALLDKVGPFGAGNAEPRFAFCLVRVVRADIVGEGHVRCVLADSGGGRMKGIAFRSADRALGRVLLEKGGEPLHIAGRLRADDWKGRQGVQIQLDDAARA